MMRSAVLLPPTWEETALTTIASGMVAVRPLEARATARANPATFWNRLRTRRTNSGRSQNVSIRRTRSRSTCAILRGRACQGKGAALCEHLEVGTRSDRVDRHGTPQVEAHRRRRLSGGSTTGIIAPP